MNPTAIYSKSGKGVQEASGKTSLLKRPDRAVLSAIDGRATLADIAQKVGKPFDASFEQLIAQLDKDGFIREVSAGTPVAAPPAKAAAKPAAGETSVGDLDFSALPPSKSSAKAAPGAQQSALNMAREEAEARAERERKRLKAEAEAKVKAELEAEMRAAAGKGGKTDAAAEKQRAEAEAKQRAEAEAKLRAETEQKIKAARDAAVRAAAEAKAKADAESKRMREVAEKARKEAEELKARLEAEHKAREEADRKVREEAEKARREAEEKARREAEELRAKLEAEHKAREEAERKAKEEAERVRRELEEERRKLEQARKAEEERRKREEEERKKREEEDRKRREEEARKAEEQRKKREEEERIARQKREEEEEAARRKKREEEERKAEEERVARRKREEEEEQARRKQREEEEARYRKEQEERHKREEEEHAKRVAAEDEERKRRAEEERKAEEERARNAEEQRKAEAAKAAPPPPPAPAAPAPTAKPAAAASIADSLLADLDSFGKQEEEEQKAKEEAERKAKADAEAKAAKAEAERRAREEAEQKSRAEAEAKARAEAERARQEAERQAKAEAEQRAREEQERKTREAEEQRRKEEERRRAQQAQVAQQRGAAVPKADDDISLSDADLDMDDIKREQQALASAAKAKPKEEEPAYVEPPQIKARKRVRWGKPVAVTLIVLLIAGLAVAHVMPLPTAGYERAASEALGRPVKIGSARLWLLTGLQLRMKDVSVGDTKIATATAYPTFGSLTDPKKVFSRIDLDGLSLPQEALAEAVFAQIKPGAFQVSRVVASKLQLPGALPLPKDLEADIAFDPAGAVRGISVRGPDNLAVKLTAKESAYDVEAGANAFTVPIAPEMTLTNFGMKGSATRQGLSIAEWDGQMLGGSLSGTANVRWDRNWTVDGVITARAINAAVLAPALLSEGRGEGTAKFTMSAPDPAKLAASGRFEGNFTVSRGVLGSFDLSRVLQTSGREAAGRTPFNEMNGRAVYDKGAVALRDVTISAGALNAGASADIAQNGALSGRIVADVRTASNVLRATLNLGGTVKEPRVRN